MAVGFFQYDRKSDQVFQIDEIIESRMTLERLAQLIMAKPYKIKTWVCDIAGDQEREQTGRSNIKYFEDTLKVSFKRRTSAINYGVSVVRSYVRNAKGQARYFVDPRCKKTIDGMKQYKYAEKNGEIQNENPIKKNDDAPDMVRYFFVNILDPKLSELSGIGNARKTG